MYERFCDFTKDFSMSEKEMLILSRIIQCDIHYTIAN